MVSHSTYYAHQALLPNPRQLVPATAAFAEMFGRDTAPSVGHAPLPAGPSVAHNAGPDPSSEVAIARPTVRYGVL